MSQTTNLEPRASIALIELVNYSDTIDNINKTENINHIKVLAMQRSTHPQDPWSGHWSFPGGKIEAGESSLEAVFREVEEEVGLRLQASDLVSSRGVHLAGKAVGSPLAVEVFHFQIQTLPKLTLDPNEVQRTRWLSKSEFTQRQLHQEFSPLSKKPDQIFPCFPMNDTPLWGFSYQILDSLWPPKDS